MAKTTQFSKDLLRLFKRRTAWLHKAIGKKRPGPAPAFTRRKDKPVLNKLAETAREIVVKSRARAEFNATWTNKSQWHVKKNKGWGIPAKRKSFKLWYEKHIQSRNCVYVFWSGRRCVYVGRTMHGKGRPASSFDKHWFNGVTRIDIYTIKTPTIVPKAECLAMHLFEPRRNAINPAHLRFSKRCPVCVAIKEIQRELNSIFPLRKKR